MKSAEPGSTISGAEVISISRHGIWILVSGRELFLSFEEFPWFQEAAVSAVMRVELPQPHHLYWPVLDVDVHVESIEHPDRFPLKSRHRPIP